MAVEEVLFRTERLLGSGRLTEATRRALTERYTRRYGPPRALGEAHMRVLGAASSRLIPSELADVVNLPSAFDAALAEGAGDGWRYAELPADLELHRRGLDALDNAARTEHGTDFAGLDAACQDALLQAASEGRLEPAGGLDTALWFEELLARLVELHYAHPAVQVEIGYDGMADADGWRDVGLAEVARSAADPT